MAHKAASPTPGGLVAFAVACYMFTGVFAGMVPKEGLLLLGCWLIGGFAVQVIVANKEIDEGEQIGGNVFLFFQGFFMLAGGLASIGKFLCIFVWGVTPNSVVEGFGWLACTIAIIMWTPCYLRNSNAQFSTAVIFLDLALIGVVLNDFGLLTGDLGAIIKYIVAAFLFISGSLGLYVASAIQLNHSFGRTILPLSKPLLKDTNR